MNIDWNRIKRTGMQSASGAAVAMITAISADFNKEAIVAALISFVSTVVVAVLMNLNNQLSE